MNLEVKSLSPLVGHKGAVLCCCVHESWFVTAGHDKRIIIWDAIAGKIKLEILGHDHIISSLDIYSGCKCVDAVNAPFVLSASWDKTVKVWNLRTGSLVCKFTGHENRVKYVKTLIESSRLSVPPRKLQDNQTISMASSGDDDGNIHVWNLITGEPLMFFDEHSRFVVRLVPYIDSSTGTPCLASVSADATIRLWDVTVVTSNHATGSSSSSSTNLHPMSVSATTSPVSTEHKRVAKGVSKSSLVAIKTSSKYISALCVTQMASDAPLLAGMTPSGSKAPLPPISLTRTHENPQLQQNQNSDRRSAHENSSSSGGPIEESIIIAGDTLGVIFIHRARTGTLLARLETKCKITELFVSNEMINMPYFPTDEQNVAAFGPAGSAFISAERSALLLHAANMKRQQSIVSKLTTSTSSKKGALSPKFLHNGSYVQDGGAEHRLTFLYYVPDNGSIGSFCLSPDIGGANLSSTDILNCISSSHLVSTSLSQQMNPLSSTTIPDTVADTSAASGANMLGLLSCHSSSFDLDDPFDAMSVTSMALIPTAAGSSKISSSSRLMPGINNNNLEDNDDGGFSCTSTAGAATTMTKKVPLLSSASERRLSTVSTLVDLDGGSGNSNNSSSSNNLSKLRKSSTYSHGLTPSGVAAPSGDSDDDGGSPSGGGGGKNGTGRVLQAFNSSAKPSVSKRPEDSSGNKLPTSVATGGSKKLKSISSSSGGVMSVSINSAEQAGKSDFPLLQCFAMTPYSAQVQRHFLLLGGREGVLLSASFSAREPTLTLVNPAEISEQESKGQPAEGGFPRPSPIITKLSSSLPAISSSSNSSPHPTSPAAHLSELYAKSSTQHAAPPVTRVKPSVMSLGSFHGSPYQPEPLVDLVMQDLRHQSPSSPQQNSKLLNSGVNIHARIAAGAGAGCDQLDEERCIKKTVSEDDVTQSELSHIMHYYDHLIGDGSRDQQRTTESDADNAHIPPRSDSGAHFSSEVPQGSHQANQQSHSISSGGGGVGGAERALTADSKGSTAEFATIVGSSSLDPQFWQAAQDAKSTYSFRRIKLNSSGNFNNSGNQSSKAGVRSPRKQYQLAPDFTRDVAPAHNQPHTPATITLEQQLQQLQRYSNQQLVPSVSQSFDQGSVISFASASRSRKGRGAYVSVSERAESYARIAKLKRSAQQQGADSRPSTTLTGIRAKSYSSSKSAEAAATSDVQQSVTAYQKGINTLRPL